MIISSITDTDDSLKEVCCVCLEKYSQEDKKVVTKCCDIVIGSHCHGHHITEFGECWNCGEKEVQNISKSQPESQARSWVSHKPEVQSAREPAIYLPQNGKGTLEELRAAQVSSFDLMNEAMKSYESANGVITKAKTSFPEQDKFLYGVSESVISELSQN